MKDCIQIGEVAVVSGCRLSVVDVCRSSPLIKKRSCVFFAVLNQRRSNEAHHRIIAFLSWAKLPYEKPFRNFQQVRLFWKFESRRETVGNTRHV